MLKISEYRKMTDANRGEGVLLGYLARRDGEATPAELSGALGVSTARIAVLLNKMERKQLVERQRSPRQRSAIVRLLPAGRELNREQEEIFCRSVVEFFEALGEEKAALFVELQREMVNFMECKQKGEHRHE